MSAETLRKAAALMRERAEAAAGSLHGVADDPLLWLGIGTGYREPIKEHIASWHPAVALAAADLLSHHAAGSPCEGCGATDGNCIGAIRSGAFGCCPDCEHDRPVRTFARAYLGEVAP